MGWIGISVRDCHHAGGVEERVQIKGRADVEFPRAARPPPIVIHLNAHDATLRKHPNNFECETNATLQQPNIGCLLLMITGVSRKASCRPRGTASKPISDNPECTWQ